MRNWNDYKTYVKKIDSQAKKDMEEMEESLLIEVGNRFIEDQDLRPLQ